jgi:hypothetical protein
MRIEPGLTDSEIATAEARFEIRFPEDLRDVLQHALPVEDGWPNWRSGPFNYIDERLRWPTEGILFDVEHNAFWAQAWGERPTDVTAALELADTKLHHVPKLIPVYSHRYLPVDPPASGLPVISVYQTDLVVYHRSIDALFRMNRIGKLEIDMSYRPLEDMEILRRIPFWGALTYWSQWQKQPDWEPGFTDSQWREL